SLFDSNNGSAIYISEPGFSGTDAFTFEVSDSTTNSIPATVTITVLPQTVQLSVSQAVTPGSVLLGTDLTYLLSITNHSPSPATGVILTDILPFEATLISGTSDLGAVTNDAV